MTPIWRWQAGTISSFAVLGWLYTYALQYCKLQLVPANDMCVGFANIKYQIACI